MSYSNDYGNYKSGDRCGAFSKQFENRMKRKLKGILFHDNMIVDELKVKYEHSMRSTSMV